jgi:hypothetical protein
LIEREREKEKERERVAVGKIKLTNGRQFTQLFHHELPQVYFLSIQHFSQVPFIFSPVQLTKRRSEEKPRMTLGKK